MNFRLYIKGYFFMLITSIISYLRKKLHLFGILLSFISIAACSHTTTHVTRFDHYIGQTYHINADATDTWTLWMQKSMTRHRSHSQGYVLAPNHSPISSDNAQHISNAHMAKIRLLRFYEHPTETPTYRATGYITLPNGKTHPCEIEWHAAIEDILHPELK